LGPLLQVVQQGSNVIVSWPATNFTYGVQTTTNPQFR